MQGIRPVVQEKRFIMLGLLTLPVMLGVGFSIATVAAKLMSSQQTAESLSQQSAQLTIQPSSKPIGQQLPQQQANLPSSQARYQLSQQRVKPSSKVRQPSQQTAKSISSRMRADALSLEIGNLVRQYNLYVPSFLDPKQPIPLLIVFHGAGGNGRGMERTTKFSQIAEQAHFIVAYPDSFGHRWNSFQKERGLANDVEFVSALIDHLDQQYPLDRRRIYVAGFSSGGVFSQRIACALSSKIAASAAVGSTMADELLQICKPTRPVPMLLVNGDSDPKVPYGPFRPGWLSVPDTAKFWSKQNRCSPQPIQEFLPNTSRVSVDIYQQCANQATVKLYVIQGGKHGWGMPKPQIRTPLGKPSQASTLSNLIWNFFAQYP
jgi:polyhydroxybutyrate depolymerase